MSHHMLIAMLLLASATAEVNAQSATDTSAASDAPSATNARPNSDAGAKRQAKSTSKASSDQAGSKQPAAKADESVNASQDEVKTLSGISILGNQEAPKSLVIVPWKSSEIGDMPGLSRLLDDSVQPIDKEVFMRELDYYEIRSSSR